ncbi:hypothetical protein P4U20_13170 [Bacillus paranthracis]|uniref:hypothetical protein n=1 Tax=Bacillus paranthracis TaxID=2026186 RepID=UPI000200F516|nr:hypothetical protein [Bacillus paranthracis]ADY24913.1 hypothetical protein YBT020_28796 [Bacillus thuringiensis serovar finitimus YBT-020]MRC74504.1 hypothetical protein [Bacillus thuringiensis]OTX69089.1 hypothetical protein BK722_18120 [Bacillus thuringiensis serovar finitimus]OTY30188.1 hypothetical protein BK736_26910 [Bacillus thuringiensis serovar poloniensis]MED1250957.1 hypothetical protein [Bacillus paranthracis]
MKGWGVLEENKKIIDIKYKQMDKDPEIKEITNAMERLVLGDKGVGLLEGLGLNPGRIQKSLDEQWEIDVNKMIEEHKSYILQESQKRSLDMMKKWIQDMEDSKMEIKKEATFKKLQELQQEVEIQVIKELVDEHL